MISDYFTLPLWERRAVLVLLLVSLVFLFLFPWYFSGRSITQVNPPDNAFMTLQMIDSLNFTQKTEKTSQKKTRSHLNRPASLHILHAFNPNKVTLTWLRSAGIPKGLSTRWINYLASGGKFRKPEDVKRIYGMDSSTWTRLLPWLQIETDTAVPAKASSYLTVIVDLNEADSATLVTLPGIGPAMAARITSYRNALGGFYSLSQLLDLKSLHSNNYNRIIERTELRTPYQKIRINHVTAAELARHPYFKKGLAGALVSYRQKHGYYTTAEDLKKCGLVSEEVLSRILPYIEFEP